MKPYEQAKRKLEALSGTRINQKKANMILRGTTGYIWCDNGRYGWSTRKSICYRFNTPRQALDDVLRYFEEGGY